MAIKVSRFPDPETREAQASMCFRRLETRDGCHSCQHSEFRPASNEWRCALNLMGIEPFGICPSWRRGIEVRG